MCRALINLSIAFIGKNQVLLTSNSIVKRLFGKMAGLIGRIEDLVVEDGEVERETETDRMGWSKISGGDLSSCLVCFQ